MIYKGRTVDAVHMDFNKAFDNVSNRRLIQKIKRRDSELAY